MNVSSTFPVSGNLRQPRSNQVGWRERLALWTRRARTRRELAHLDDRLLQDIGLRRADALRETAKPFWKP